MNKVNIHSLFVPNYYSLDFKSRVLKQRFNLELAEYKTAAQYIKLSDKYNLY
jgi:hypothetical protein